MDTSSTKRKNRKRMRGSPIDDDAGSQRSQLQQKHPWNPKGDDYEVDYNDHFETPLQAYQDLLPLLDAIKSPREQHILYDPYYCNGQTKRLLQSLGFTNVLHEKRDFYKDVAQGSVPSPHDTFVTNPPYSDQHKEKCLRYCFQQLRQHGTPFFLLMPTYVAAKQYYRRLLDDQRHASSMMMYLVPFDQSSYHYSHPEGTGHETCPFPSMWFCGVGADRSSHLQRAWKNTQNDDSKTRLVLSYEELVSNKIITLNNRPNPRQRQKKRKKGLDHAVNLVAANGSISSSAMPQLHSKDSMDKSTENSSGRDNESNGNKRSVTSKYRDEAGKRLKKRF
jgi:hypothetical protein